MAATDALKVTQPSVATDFLRQSQAQMQQQQATAGAERKEMAPVIAETERQIGTPRPAAPGLEAAPAAPKGNLTQDVNGWMQAAVLLAGIAGLTTRQHVTNALSAFGAFGQGFSKGKLQASNEAYKQWEVANQKIQEDNQNRLREYTAALEDRKLGLDEQMARMQLVAAKYKDTIMAEAAAAKNFTLVASLIDRQQLALANLQQHTDAMEQRWNQFKMEFEAKYGPMDTYETRVAAFKKFFPPPPDLQSNPQAQKDYALKLQDFVKPGGLYEQMRDASGAPQGPVGLLDQKTLDMMADQYLAGDRSVLQGLGYGNLASRNRAALRDAIQKKAADRGMSGKDIAMALAEFGGTQQAERTAGQRAAQVSIAGHEANNMAQLVLDASEQVPRTGWVPVNRALLAYERNTGDPAVVRFGAALNSFINAYARAISPTGTPTEGSREHAREMLNAAYTKEQVRQIVDQLKLEMQSALAAPSQTREELRQFGGVRPSVQPEHGARPGGGWKVEPVQ